MQTPLRRRGLTLLYAIPLLAAAVIATSEYTALRRAADQGPITRLQALAGQQPWGGLTGRQLAVRLDTRWRVDPAGAADALDWQLTRYPLDPWRWLLRARIERTLDPDTELSRQRLEAAIAVQPNHRELRWRAANLAQNFGDVDLIADYLQLWLRGQPGQVHSALFIAARWLPDPEQRLDRVLPPGEEYLVQAMRHARISQQPQLAHAVWQRLEQPRAPDDPAVREYILSLQAAGEDDAILALWQQLDPDYRPGDIPGGSFAFDLDGLAAFGWDLRVPAGVDLTRVETGPDQTRGALRLIFDGNENVQLVRPLLRFPAPPPGHYRFSGWWKAEHLTTRSLPRLALRELEGPMRTSIELPSAHFDWQPFAAEFELTEPGDRLQFQIIRRRTEAFDRNLGGELQLAGLRLEPILREPETGTIDTP